MGHQIAKIADWDRRVLLRVYNIQNPRLTRFLRIFTYIGSTPFWMAVSIACFIPAVVIHYMNPALQFIASILLDFCGYLFMSFVVSGAVLVPLKYSIQRQRPHQKFIDVPSRDYFVTDPSFPSGHCAQWVFYSWIVATYLVGEWYMVVALASLPLIMFSRIYLGSHFPTDTFVGVAIGATIIVLLGIFAPAFDQWYHWLYVMLQQFFLHFGVAL